MKKNTIDINQLAQYEDQYVALSQNREKVLAVSKTIKALEKKLKLLQIKNAVIEYVVPINVSISPVCR